FHGITSNDLDDYIKTGTFNVSSNNNTNTPDVVDIYGILEVKDMGSGIILQTYIERPSTRTHVRVKSGTTAWSDWDLKQEYPIMNKEGRYNTSTTLGVDSTDLNDY